MRGARALHSSLSASGFARSAEFPGPPSWSRDRDHGLFDESEADLTVFDGIRIFAKVHVVLMKSLMKRLLVGHTFVLTHPPKSNIFELRIATAALSDAFSEHPWGTYTCSADP